MADQSINRNFNPDNFDPNQNPVASALRGPPAVPVVPPGARIPTPIQQPISPEEQALRDAQNRKQAADQAALEDIPISQGSGLIGITQAIFRKINEGGRLTEREQEIYAELSEQERLTNMRAAREFTDAQKAAQFKLESEAQIDINAAQQATREQQAAAAARIEEETRVRRVGQIREDKALIEATQLEEQRRLEETQLENQRIQTANEEAQRRVNNERSWDQMATVNSAMRSLNNRRDDLKRVLPYLAQMAGEKDYMGDIDRNDAWNNFMRRTGGAGELSTLNPLNFRRPTKELARYEKILAIQTLGSIDTPLTPVSDKDLETIFGMGINDGNSEAMNFDLAMESLAAIEAEMTERTKQLTNSTDNYNIDNNASVTPMTPAQTQEIRENIARILERNADGIPGAVNELDSLEGLPSANGR